jgi:hypothetical protein
MFDKDYKLKVVGVIFGAAMVIPGIATGFYLTYQLVTMVGN